MQVKLTLINATVADITNSVCVYSHMDARDGQVKYVGMCALTEVLNFTDARCNSLWPDIFLKPDAQIIITVESLHGSEQEAIKARYDFINALPVKPICNAKGYNIAPHRQDVLCNETGERWKSVKETAQAHNLSESALSNHLNGKPGYRTVKGRTYRRIV